MVIPTSNSSKLRIADLPLRWNARSVKATNIPNIARRWNRFALSDAITFKPGWAVAVGSLLHLIILADGVLSTIGASTRAGWDAAGKTRISLGLQTTQPLTSQKYLVRSHHCTSKCHHHSRNYVRSRRVCCIQALDGSPCRHLHSPAHRHRLTS